MEQEDYRPPGRWILSPKRGSRFVGSRERARLRARERRRQVLVFLLETIGVTGLIGLFPPLRGMLMVTAVLAFLFLVYLALVLWVSHGRRPVSELAGPDRVVVVPEAGGRVEAGDGGLVRAASP